MHKTIQNAQAVSVQINFSFTVHTIKVKPDQFLVKISRYDFPQKWIAPLKIASLKVFVNAENLLTFSDFDIFDPERSLTSDYIWSYPSVKSFTGGINVTF